MNSDDFSSDVSRIVVFGEVLFDVFPDGRKVAGGAPYNVARHLAAMGLNPLFISRVGDDAMGRAILDEMDKLGLDRAGVGVDGKYATGTVEVSMEHGEPEYDIVQNVAWDHIDYQADAAGGVLYHGSLAARSPGSAATLDRLSKGPRFVDLNLRPPWYTVETVSKFVNKATILKLNIHEMRELSEMMGVRAGTVEQSAARILGEADLASLFVTDGEHGATAVTREGESAHVPAEKRDGIQDTVGAGDAFSAVCLCGEAMGWDLRTTLRRASALAADICTIRGAFPESSGLHAKHSEDWGLESCR